MPHLFKLTLTVLALVLVGLVACSSGPDEPEMPEGLVGVWQWVETCFPYPSDCLTPESEGYDRFMSFASDSTFEEYRDSEIMVEGEFGVIRGDIGDGVMRDLLVFDVHTDTLVFLFEDVMTMTLSEGMAGSSVARWQRQPIGIVGKR